jgi:hypothetical protein
MNSYNIQYQWLSKSEQYINYYNNFNNIFITNHFLNKQNKRAIELYNKQLHLHYFIHNHTIHKYYYNTYYNIWELRSYSIPLIFLTNIPYQLIDYIKWKITFKLF